MHWKTILAAWSAGVVLLLGFFGPAQIARSEGIEVLRVRPDFYMIGGAGGNIGVQIGPDGVVLVDAGTEQASGQVMAEIKKLTDQPIRYIIDTSADADFVGGNARLARAGRTIFAMANNDRGNDDKLMTNGGAASILASQNVLLRMSAPTGKVSPFSSDAWPTESFSQNRKYIYLNHEPIEIFHHPAAHSDGDSIVFFRISDVVVAGDILDTTRFPVIDVEKGGSVQGEIDALNHIVELAISPIPFVFQEGGTYVLPGHGRICDQFDVVEYRDMVVIIRDVIQDMIRRGMTLEQIQAASPAKPYEKQYGTTFGPWTTNDFIEAVYKSLTGKGQ
jgi:glyoxylase-like metal-dependent hydrolase (beta-lactamase superfamily II)